MDYRCLYPLTTNLQALVNRTLGLSKASVVSFMRHHVPKSKVVVITSDPICSDLMLELHVLRDILMHKYGREFSITVMENVDGCVNERVRRFDCAGLEPTRLV